MKRDIDLVRQILIAIEESDEDPRACIVLELDGYEQETICRHVQIMTEAGLVESIDISTFGGFQVWPRRLTWAGHDFLDAARNDRFWKKAKDRAGTEFSNLPISVIKDLLIQAAKETMQL